MRRLAPLAVASVIALGIAAPAGANPDSDAVNAVVAFNPPSDAAFERLDAVIDARKANASVLRPQLTTGSKNRRLATAYIAHHLARTSADYRMLDRRLGDPDPSVRAMVAFGLLG